MDVLDEKALRKKMQSAVEVQSQLHKEVWDKVQANRGKQVSAASRGILPNFAVGDYVLVARVRRSVTSYPGRFETCVLLGCVPTRTPLSRSLLS